MKRILNKSANAMRKKDTGKSLSKIKPDNIQVFGSYVITDPKGELYRNSENCFSKRGNYMKRNLLSNSHFKLFFQIAIMPKKRKERNPTILKTRYDLLT